MASAGLVALNWCSNSKGCRDYMVPSVKGDQCLDLLLVKPYFNIFYLIQIFHNQLLSPTYCLYVQLIDTLVIVSYQLSPWTVIVFSIWCKYCIAKLYHMVKIIYNVYFLVNQQLIISRASHYDFIFIILQTHITNWWNKFTS